MLFFFFFKRKRKGQNRRSGAFRRSTKKSSNGLSLNLDLPRSRSPEIASSLFFYSFPRQSNPMSILWMEHAVGGRFSHSPQKKSQTPHFTMCKPKSAHSTCVNRRIWCLVVTRDSTSGPRNIAIGSEGLRRHVNLESPSFSPGFEGGKRESRSLELNTLYT